MNSSTLNKIPELNKYLKSIQRNSSKYHNRSKQHSKKKNDPLLRFIKEKSFQHKKEEDQLRLIDVYRSHEKLKKTTNLCRTTREALKDTQDCTLRDTQHHDLSSTRHVKRASVKKHDNLEKTKQFLQGNNCKIIVNVLKGDRKTILDTDEHYIAVTDLKDLSSTLKELYPTRYLKVKNFKEDFLWQQGLLDAKQLNGKIFNLEAHPIMQVRGTVSMEYFTIVKQIGLGGFSKVYLCQSKIDGGYYAMKVIDKETIIRNKKKRIIMNERNIMKKSDHPFLIDMKYAFETEKYLVFILEYCMGGEMFQMLRRKKRLSEAQARFYIIEVFLGLSYLHSNHTVYRDIKPENILLTKDGHIKIADLGLAKPNMFDGELAYSFCGSPEYMSPEMILETGHTYPIDYYCVGALIYQLLIGIPPFYSKDPEEIYDSVIHDDIYFPSEIQMSKECKSLITSLLCKDVKHRLGSMHQIKEILAHPWFGKQSYQDYLSKTVKPLITFSPEDLSAIFEKNSQKQVIEPFLKEVASQSAIFRTEMPNFYYDWEQQRNPTTSSDMNINMAKKDMSRKTKLSQDLSCMDLIKSCTRQQIPTMSRQNINPVVFGSLTTRATKKTDPNIKADPSSQKLRKLSSKKSLNKFDFH